jgi:AraC family transcriptional regulator
VPSRATHHIDANDCDVSVVLFIEPETAAGKALSAQLNGALEVLDAEQVFVSSDRLDRAWRTEKSYEAVIGVCQQLAQEIARTPFREPSDPRVLAAIEHIRRRVDQTVDLP